MRSILGREVSRQGARAQRMDKRTCFCSFSAPPRLRVRVFRASTMISPKIQDIILITLLMAEVFLFSAIGKNFLTTANALEIVRLSAEVGLIAVALTPVIISGGIDLSVGSLMGL